MWISILCYIAIANIIYVTCDDNNHFYTSSEVVSLWVNTIGPYHNPQETYSYYSLPFCKPTDLETKKRPSGIGEVLEGHYLTNSGLLLHFNTNVKNDVFCEIHLDESIVSQFEHAIDEQYWYEMYLDDLPMWGMVGETLRDEEHGKMEKHVFTHSKYLILLLVWYGMLFIIYVACIV
jgi:transmembrane 9 superfamily member 3